MKVVFDATFVMLLLDEHIAPPADPGTGKPVDRVKARMDHLVATFEKEKTTIIVPTPALSELLVKAEGAGPKWLTILDQSSHIQIADFDTLAAVEAAAAFADALHKHGNIKGGLDINRQKLKFDRQIVAIAKVHSADRIYTCDHQMESLVDDPAIQVIHVADVPLPPEDPQMDMLEPLDDD